MRKKKLIKALRAQIKTRIDQVEVAEKRAIANGFPPAIAHGAWGQHNTFYEVLAMLDQLEA